jgi:hypothetical protein
MRLCGYLLLTQTFTAEAHQRNAEITQRRNQDTMHKKHEQSLWCHLWTKLAPVALTLAGGIPILRHLRHGAVAGFVGVFGEI